MEDLLTAVRASWDADTCDPVDLPWSVENPSRSQCGVSALVLQDHLGGELLVAEVLHDDGSRQGFHVWNRLPDGTELDLTREQFAPHEQVQEPSVVVRPPSGPARCAEQYALPAQRVRARL